MKKKAAYRRRIRQTGTVASERAKRQIRHDLLTRERLSIFYYLVEKISVEKRIGNPLVKTSAAYNDTPELNALKALFGAPISMGRGENPVEL